MARNDEGLPRPSTTSPKMNAPPDPSLRLLYPFLWEKTTTFGFIMPPYQRVWRREESCRGDTTQSSRGAKDRGGELYRATLCNHLQLGTLEKMYGRCNFV
jgi:hypothetical protein